MKGRNLIIGAIVLNAVVGLIYAYNNSFISVVSLLVMVNVLVLLLLYRCMSRLMVAFTPVTVGQEQNEQKIRDYLEKLVSLEGDMKLLISCVGEIGNEIFSSRISALKNEDIKMALASANDGILALRDKERASNWITNGVATIAGMKQTESGIGTYAYDIITEVVNYLGANQGGFFLLREDGDVYLELAACHAYGKKKYQQKCINAGEGLLGQVIYEKDIVLMTDVPKDYVKITSGLGEALPACICIVPLLYEQKLYGAIELASFKVLDQTALEYLRKISETIGYNLASIESRERTDRLLKETQNMAEEVRLREEELRQNMEELTATQEDMKRKQAEHDAVLSSLSTVELDPEGRIVSANEIFLGITGYKLGDLVGKMYRCLIPQQGNDVIQYGLMWDSILAGRSFSGEFRIMARDKREMWMIGNFTPILDRRGSPSKIMVISLFSNQDKEKLAELQEFVTALKNCFPMAEINPDMSFKSANEQFLAMLGIKRLELRKTHPKTVFSEHSYSQLETSLRSMAGSAQDLVVDIQEKDGALKTYNSALVGIGSADKRGLLILKHLSSHGTSKNRCERNYR
ncbi:MAG TPA: GAF domain-containing protein [Cyclobacteriaceae bacterium]|jgi:PAS domain S-box-containing protein|nr:GAF domain-containing protein [Cyclobacteriaceae bacterium]